MTDANPVDPERVGSAESEPAGPRVTDKRRLDPENGAVRAAGPATEDGPDEVVAEPVDDANEVAGEATEVVAEPVDDATEVTEVVDVPEAVVVEAAAASDVFDAGDVPQYLDVDEIHPDTTLAADLTRDLQRLQAEYVNYKKRVDRDRALNRDVAVASVIEALLPVLDDIHLARQHGDLEGGPFAAIADKLDGTLAKFGVERFGQPGDAFDPMVHEALMHTEAELAVGTEVTTVVQVLQPGYRMGERVVRAARVAVADPKPNPQT